MAKFQKGDLLKIVSVQHADNLGFYVPGMDGLVGKTGIAYIDDIEQCVQLQIDGPQYWYHESCFRRIRKAKAIQEEIVFEPPIVQDIDKLAKKLKDAQELRVKFTDEMGDKPSGTCSYAISYKDGGIRTQIKDACHARIYPSKFGEYKEPAAVVLHLKAHYKDSLYKEAYVKWVDYIINRSPWAPVFLFKDAKDSIENCAALDIDMPMTRVLGAAVVLREASEFEYGLNVFAHALDLGYSEHVAYLLSCCFTKADEKLSYKDISNVHRVLHPYLKIDKLVRFFVKGYPVKKRPIYRDFRGYNIPIYSEICDQGGNNFGRFVEEFQQNIKLKFGEKEPSRDEALVKVADALTNLFKDVK